MNVIEAKTLLDVIRKAGGELRVFNGGLVLKDIELEPEVVESVCRNHEALIALLSEEACPS